MYRPGHYGMVLLLYSIGYILLSKRHDSHALDSTILVVLVTMSPDWDGLVGWVPHRGPTHSIGFALLVGAFLGAVVVLDGYRRGQSPRTTVGLGTWAAGLGTFSVCCHLVADALNPLGIRPFYPVSDYHVSLDLVPASDPVANGGLLAAGLLVTIGCWRFAGDRAVHEESPVAVLLRNVYWYFRDPDAE